MDTSTNELLIVDDDSDTASTDSNESWDCLEDAPPFVERNRPKRNKFAWIDQARGLFMVWILIGEYIPENLIESFPPFVFLFAHPYKDDHYITAYDLVVPGFVFVMGMFLHYTVRKRIAVYQIRQLQKKHKERLRQLLQRKQEYRERQKANEITSLDDLGKVLFDIELMIRVVKQITY